MRINFFQCFDRTDEKATNTNLRTQDLAINQIFQRMCE